jgi:antitoxin MazE
MPKKNKPRERPSDEVREAAAAYVTGTSTVTRIVPLGNSQGVRIPKPLLEQSGLSGEVELIAERRQILIRAARRPRQAWEAAFRDRAAAGEGGLLDPDLTGAGDWDREEWEW